MEVTVKGCILPERASLVVAERNLYAVQCHLKDESPRYIFQYNAKQNMWKQLPSMNESHGLSFNVVYLCGYIYIIWDSTFSGLAERYNMAEQVWEMLPNLPSLYEWTSAVAYEGNILVYGTNSSTHEIHQYNPSTNTWQIVFSHQVSPDVISHHPSPVLFEYQDKVYRVMYKSSDEFPHRNIPVVNKLQMHHSRGRISVGEEVNQDLVAGNKLHSLFCIQDQIFINIKGFIQPTDMKMNHGEADDPVSERIWTEFRLCLHMNDAGNIACVTFDKKKLGWAPGLMGVSRF